MKLSILTPIFNDEEPLADARKQALAVIHPREIEPIVFDDGTE